jgi:hypothetical protein
MRWARAAVRCGGVYLAAPGVRGGVSRSARRGEGRRTGGYRWQILAESARPRGHRHMDFLCRAYTFVFVFFKKNSDASSSSACKGREGSGVCLPVALCRLLEGAQPLDCCKFIHVFTLFTGGNMAQPPIYSHSKFIISRKHYHPQQPHISSRMWRCTRNRHCYGTCIMTHRS